MNGFKPEDNKKPPPLPSWSPMDHVRSIMPRRGIQPGEERWGASKSMRAGVSTKKRVPASLIRRFAQINCYGGPSRMVGEDGGSHCGGSF
jgi:hypothetical protein